jgi:hypothetical protein
MSISVNRSVLRSKEQTADASHSLRRGYPIYARRHDAFHWRGDDGLGLPG